MKKIYPAYAIILVAIATAAMSFSVLRVGGSPGAKTGSPGDVNSCLQCHTGSANSVNDWITSDIPETGYVPEEKYIITTSGSHSGVGLFGFELTAEDASNSKTGTFTINDDGTKLVNSDAAVTHNNSGTTPSGDAKSWTAEWTAPSAGTGEVTFYAAINAADGTGGTNNDVIYLTSLAVSEGSGSGLFDIVSANTIYPYPNPVTSRMKFDLPSDVRGNVEIRIFNTGGQTVYEHVESASSGLITVDMSEYNPGTYFVIVKSSEQEYFGRVVKN